MVRPNVFFVDFSHLFVEIKALQKKHNLKIFESKVPPNLTQARTGDFGRGPVVLPLRIRTYSLSKFLICYKYLPFPNIRTNFNIYVTKFNFKNNVSWRRDAAVYGPATREHTHIYTRTHTLHTYTHTHTHTHIYI